MGCYIFKGVAPHFIFKQGGEKWVDIRNSNFRLSLSDDAKRNLITAILFITTAIACIMVTTIVRDMTNQGKIKSLEVELEKSSTRIDLLESELAKCNETISSLEEQNTNEALINENKQLKNELETLREELKTKIENNSQGTNLGIYNTYSKLDDERASNLILAISRLDGYTLKSGATLDVNKLIGPYSASSGYVYIPNIREYSAGTEEIIQAVYSCALNAAFKIEEYHLNNDGIAYVNNSANLVITNDSRLNYKLNCKYTNGFIAVYFSTK